MTRLGFMVRREWLSLAFGAVLVVLVVNVLAGPQGPRDLLALRKHRTSLESERLRIAAENTTFRTTVQRLRSDESYLQRMIRRELGYARADEMVFRFGGDSESPAR